MRGTLLTNHPSWEERLKEDWDWEKNEAEGIIPSEVGAGSHRRANWVCHHCGKQWKTTIEHRTSGSNCPKCSKWVLKKKGSIFLTDHPAWEEKLGEEWDYVTNEANHLIPEEMVSGSKKKAAWICSQCGWRWSTQIVNRTSGRGCPKCAKKKMGKRSAPLLCDHPSWKENLCREWNYAKNENIDLKPEEITVGSKKKAFWTCPKCGFLWAASIHNRVMGTGCPKCASSHGEKDAASWAKSRGFVVVEQWRHPDCRDRNPLPFDLMLYIPAGNALMEVSPVEYDGEQHSNLDTYFNRMHLLSGRGLDYTQRHDGIKTNFCLHTHRILIRVPHTVTGLDDIGAFLEKEFKANGLGWALTA